MRRRCVFPHVPSVRSQKWVLWLSLGLIAVTIGCGGGDSGPVRFHVSGKVTFDGKPVKFGSIQFEPDVGNKGPQGFAEIRDGSFDTRKRGDGVIPGKVISRITGLQNEPQPNNDEPVTALFEGHEVRLELPSKDSTKDFDIPKQAAEKKANVVPVDSP